MSSKKRVPIYRSFQKNLFRSENALWLSDIRVLLDKLPSDERFDLIVTSPPYNLGKEYERKMPFEEYVSLQKEIIPDLAARLSATGSLCWQVGNFVDNGQIVPLDMVLHPIFNALGLKLRNRIIWHFGHGLHSRRRFSGRYEVVLWYTKTDQYTFNLDDVRVPAKYPAKRYYKGPKKGQYSSNPSGKNPEDVWSIPNVKSNHIEKTNHPCQFPVGLVERLVLALTNPGDRVFDPFAGVGSAGVAALLHTRRFWGCDIELGYLETAKARLDATLQGAAQYRPHTKPLYDHTRSSLSIMPEDLTGDVSEE